MIGTFGTGDVGLKDEPGIQSGRKGGREEGKSPSKGSVSVCGDDGVD